MKASRIAIRIGDEVSVHMDAGSYGNYATLCGLSDDDDNGVSVPVPRNGRARIDCDHCRSIWSRSRRYSASDFKAGEAQ